MRISSPLPPKILVAFGVAAVVGGCLGDEATPDAAGELAIEVAPLTLAGVVDVAYDLRVVNDLGDTVWERSDLRASAYGNGTSLSYVGPCDAASNAQPNRVELDVVTLYDADGALDAGDWVDPTAVEPLKQEVTCVENSDVPVAFDVAIMRRATQGFFDVAVEFDDIFCSAKFDCEQEDGSPNALLFGPDGRVPTAVLALACTSGAGGDTRLYLDDLTIDCGGAETTIDVSAGPGNLYTLDPDTAPTPLHQAAIFQGEEQLTDASLGDLSKRYFNVALAVDFAETTGGCTLTTVATAHDGPLDGDTTPAGTYPVIRYEVPLVNAAGDDYDCGQMALDDPAGASGDRVASAYVVTPPGETFDVMYGGTLPDPDPETPYSQVFTATGADQQFTVPAGVTELSVKAWGAGGGGGAATPGAAGGYVEATFPVTPGDVLTVVVGGGGLAQAYGGAIVAGGYGGGGDTGPSSSSRNGGSGGGLSGVFSGGAALTFDATGQARSLVIAGGGAGGAGWYNQLGGNSGAGGGAEGLLGSPDNSDSGYTVYVPSRLGYPGTQTAGGLGCTGSYCSGYDTDGGPLQGGEGATYGGSGGGGGYFGGGGSTAYHNGGGGSGYVTPAATASSLVAGVRQTPPSTGVADYVSGVGVGGARGGGSSAQGDAGGDGLVVIDWLGF